MFDYIWKRPIIRAEIPVRVFLRCAVNAIEIKNICIYIE